MPVQLLPFQKLVDMPDLAQRHRRAISGLAIASSVLISIILCLLVMAYISGSSMGLYSTNILFSLLGMPSMVILLILVYTSSCISLRNTNAWESTDVCCNLMRSHPTCCTKSCAGNKHCCARMSCLHIHISVITSLFCVLLVCLLFSGCGDPGNHRRYNDNYSRHLETPTNYHHQYQSEGYSRDAVSKVEGCKSYVPSEKTVKVGTRVTLISDRDAFKNAFNSVDYIWDDAMTTLLGQTVTVVDRPQPGIFGLPKSDTRSGQPVWWYPFYVIDCVNDQPDKTTTTKYYDESEYVVKSKYGPAERSDRSQQENHGCSVLSGFEVPALILMICLVATTARSAWLLREIEQGQPEIELLPAGKMVVHAFEDLPAVIQTGVVVGDVHVMQDEKSNTDLETEQNV